MRVLPLYGLVVGLAGLVATSPTPANPLARDAAVPPRRLVLYAQDEFEGPAHEIEATNRCVKLESPVYKNVHSYKVVNQICTFMDTDRCNGKAVKIVDAQGSQFWAAKVDEDVGKIAAVYCGGVEEGAVEDDTVLGKRVDGGPLDALSPGQIITCEDTSMKGHCKTISAEGPCVSFPAGLAYNFQTIHQAPGSVCRYFGDKCDEESHILDIESKMRGQIDTFGQGFAALIGSVKCYTIWIEADVGPTTSLTEKRDISANGGVKACSGNHCSYVAAFGSCQAFSDGVANQIDKIVQKAGSTCDYWGNKDCSRLIVTSTSGSKDYSPDLGPGNRDGLEISAVSCKASQFAETAEDGQTIRANHAVDARSLAARSVSAVPCDDPHFLDHNRQILPGYLYFCATTNHATVQKLDDCADYRSCMSLSAMNTCVSLKASRNLFPDFDSLWQAHGAVCKYYRSSCSDTYPALIIDSRNFYWPPINYKKLPFVPVITEARCQTFSDDEGLGAGPGTFVVNSLSFLSSLHARYADESLSSDSASDHQAGDGLIPDEPYLTDPLSSSAPILTSRTNAIPIVDYPTMLQACHDVDLGGKCFHYTGPGCGPNPFNVDAIESLFLPRGWRCALYPYWNCSAERGPPHYIEARDGDLTVNDVEYEIWSITCVPLPF